MDLFTYLLGKKGQNTQRDLFSYLLGKGAGGSGTYVNFSGTSLNISNTLRARIKNITLKGATSQNGTPTPEAPIPIKVVTGEQNVNISSRNLFELKTPDYTGQDAANGYGSTNYIKLDNGYRFPNYLNAIAFQYNNLIPGEQYTISFNYISKSNVQNYFNVGNNVYRGYSGSGQSYKAFYARTTSQKGILTFTASTTNRIAFDSGYTNGMQLEITNIQLEKSPTATDFVPYYNKDYPLSLGNMELAEITENYQDYIYGTPNNWYKYKYINKVIFNGTEDWSKLVENTNTVQFLLRSGIPEKARGLYNAMSDLFKTYSGNVEEECITGQSANTGLQIIINKTRANTSADFKTWLSTHNVTAYYELNTPTQEQITDTTLIEQLNNLYNATSQEGTTYITCSSASDSNEIIVFSGDIKVASVGLSNPLNTSLLSSNIQEEPNLDDVNETEDIEQNDEPIEEPIEEEVS